MPWGLFVPWGFFVPWGRVRAVGGTGAGRARVEVGAPTPSGTLTRLLTYG